MPGFSEISPAQLNRLIGTPDAPLIIDVRIAEDLAANPNIIPTSQLCVAQDVESLFDKIETRRTVVVCHKGKKLSHGAAALLRSSGIAAEVLSGGSEAWRVAEYLAIPMAKLPKQQPSLWVTRHRPKIDRIACPWLIRRFVDPNARFLYVPPAEVNEIASRFNATPFDMPGVPFSHHANKCTFDAMLDHFSLHSDALDRLAQVVRAADLNAHDMAPQAAGLLAMSVGLSRMHKDDLDQLDAALPLYDALYRWARDGHTEQHDIHEGPEA